MRSIETNHTKKIFPDLEGGKVPLPTAVLEIGGHTMYQSLWIPYGKEKFELLRKNAKKGTVGLSVVISPREGCEHPEISIKLIEVVVE